MSTPPVHTIDARTRRTRDRAAYRLACRQLDRDDVLWSASAVLPLQRPRALLRLITAQLREPYTDVSRVVISPQQAQRIARAWLEAVAVSIDGLATMQRCGEE